MDAGRGTLRGLRRGALALGLLALSLLAGDRSRAAFVPAGTAGQDPLEVLELKIRPNVIIVLDSSGSMQWWLTNNNFSLNSGDHPRSRLNQAKRVLRQVVAANQNKVSFQFGTYTQYGGSFNNQGAGAHRFQYVTDDVSYPFMTTSELTLQGALGDTTLGRGLQSWQIIYPEWGTLYYDEDTDASGGVNASACAATLTGLPKFYASGASLATELAAAMNVANCATGNRVNTYGVSYDASNGRFTITRSGGPRYWRIQWGRTPNNIRNALRETQTSTTGWQNPGSWTTDGPWTLLYRTTGTGSSGTGLNLQWTFTETVNGTPTNFYNMRAGRFWNGEVIRVDSTGRVCGMDFATASSKSVPASIVVAEADASCNPTVNTARFVWGGGSYTGNNRSCNGFRSKSQLIPCDLKSPPAPLQFTTISPYIDNELPLNASGDPADWNNDGTVDYQEAMDGSWATTTVNIAPSARAAGSTPIANSLIDIKGRANSGDTSCITNAEALYPALDDNAGTGSTGACVERNFSLMWNTGLSTGPWTGIPAAQRAIKNHSNPKERTIVIVVTDGDDTCGSRTGSIGSGSFTGANGQEQNSRRAAYYAADLYARIDPAEPASSVQTYVVGYGGSFPVSDPYLLNVIAWGGSGLAELDADNNGSPDISFLSSSETALRNARSLCATCTDAFVAPDATTLASQLQAIIDQGASDGEFNAQQSITESVYEYVDLAGATYDAAKPGQRYRAIVPTRFISSFTLPGFQGQQKAYQNDGAGGTVLKWSAGDVLRNQVATAMATGDGFAGACNTAAQGGAVDECTFAQLHGGASDANVRTSTARIKRRIYTTSGNGVFPYTVDSLIDGTTTGNAATTGRVALWPPTALGLMHSDSPSDNGAKSYDVPLGLPPDTPTSFPPNPVDPKCDPGDTRPTIATPKKPYDECWFGWLQSRFQACRGTNLPASCTTGTFAQRMTAARREAREISIAFMAGAAPVANPGAGAGVKRTSGVVGSTPVGSLLYKARSWILADSELATAAVVTPPLPSEPTATPYVDEYRLFRDGPRESGVNPERSVGAPAQIKMGFGLRNPDADGTVPSTSVDTQIGLKPVMTVLYAPANDMLHAFRAAPCDSPGLSVPCNEQGGEELWGFVPYDQLHTIMLRAAHEPQGKDNHVYSLARGARFSDVFIPGAYSRALGSGSVSSAQGVWRRVLFIGRGIGGKYMTAIDVTGPGPYTEYALDTRPPEPLWSRGNPDTRDGLVTGTPNGTASDYNAYLTMGETWSIPVIAYVNNAIYGALRYVLYMGSGYSSVAGEGTTFYTLDALSGNVVATADVGSRGGFGSYSNALVANAVGFNPAVFSPLTTVHPAASEVKRVYIGDIHGRLWKFLTARPDVALQVADLGSDQVVGAAASLLGLPPQPGTPVPHIFVNSGADSRSRGPFQMFAFRDDGTDTDIALGAGATVGTVTTYLPAVQLFSRFYDQGTPNANCGYTEEAVFRGTVQPAAAFECSGISAGQCGAPIIGRVFYAGTRLSLPNTRFAPITPLACGAGVYPCRSQFDSIIYALGATTGLAAYDLNSSGDDAYRIFRDSRVAAITVQADPDPGRGGSSFTPDEGLMKGVPKPPPPPGVPPTATTATANVVMVREPGQPAPAIRYGSTVCQ